MSSYYHYEPGANHYDHHRDISVTVPEGVDPIDFVKALINRSDIEDIEAETISSETKKRGPREQKLFLDPDIAEQEKQRLLSFLRLHKKGSSDFDSSEENACNQIAVCFFRQWSKRHLLNTRAGGTAFVRFLRDDCELSITVEEKALANVFSKMINSSDKYPEWHGDVCAYFSE